MGDDIFVLCAVGIAVLAFGLVYIVSYILLERFDRW
jgi:hypothetical protein